VQRVGNCERAVVFVVSKETDNYWARGEEKGGKRKFWRPNPK